MISKMPEIDQKISQNARKLTLICLEMLEIDSKFSKKARK
jgi:hypothetical protein